MTEVFITEEFDRETRRLAKKYRNVGEQIDALRGRLLAGEQLGDRMQGTNAEVYKIRLPNPDAQRGKSGGFRRCTSCKQWISSFSFPSILSQTYPTSFRQRSEDSLTNTQTEKSNHPLSLYIALAPAVPRNTPPASSNIHSPTTPPASDNQPPTLSRPGCTCGSPSGTAGTPSVFA